MNKKVIIILCSCILSFITAINKVEIVFNDVNVMIQILFSILGLCLTAYTFILVPINKLLKSNEKINSVKKLLNEYKDNMIFIFFSSIILIFISIICKLDIPSLTNPTHIDFGLFEITSLKIFFKIFFEDSISFLCLYSFYDIMKSIFVLIDNIY